MYGVVLAAGRGTRMRPLTDRRPKPLLPVGDRSLLERVFDTVAGVVDEFVVVVGYRGDAIRDAIGESYRSYPVHYVEQAEALGTAHAVARAGRARRRRQLPRAQRRRGRGCIASPLPCRRRGDSSRGHGGRRSSGIRCALDDRGRFTRRDRREARRPADESRERRLLRVYARGLRVYR